MFKTWSRSESKRDKRELVSIGRPETGCSTHGQDEDAVKGNGGPNAHPLKRVAMNCG